MARRQPRGQETRDRLLAAAQQLFTEQGYGAVGVEDISRAAGVTKGAFYYWFRDKADVARDVRHRVFQNLTDHSLDGIDLTTDPLTAMLIGFERFVGALPESGPTARFLQEVWTMPADRDGPFDQELAVALIRDVLAAAVQRGEVVELDPDSFAVFFVAGCSSLALHALATGARAEAVAVVAGLLGSIRPAPVAPTAEVNAQRA